MSSPRWTEGRDRLQIQPVRRRPRPPCPAGNVPKSHSPQAPEAWLAGNRHRPILGLQASLSRRCSSAVERRWAATAHAVSHPYFETYIRTRLTRLKAQDVNDSGELLDRGGFLRVIHRVLGGDVVRPRPLALPPYGGLQKTKIPYTLCRDVARKYFRAPLTCDRCVGTVHRYAICIGVSDPSGNRS